MRITAVHPAAQLVLPLWTNVFSKDHDGILASEQTHCKLLHFLQVLTLLTPFIFDSQRPSMRALHFCSQASITCSPSGCSLTIRFWQLVHGGSDGFSRMSSKSHTVHRIIYIYIWVPFCMLLHSLRNSKTSFKLGKYKKWTWIYFLITLDLDFLSVTSPARRALMAGAYGSTASRIPARSAGPTLPETDNSHLKMDEYDCFLLGHSGIQAYFQGLLLFVSGSVPAHQAWWCLQNLVGQTHGPADRDPWLANGGNGDHISFCGLRRSSGKIMYSWSLNIGSSNKNLTLITH